jgi:RNA polymerase sigma-70 factor, ECF subfamily
MAFWEPFSFGFVFVAVTAMFSKRRPVVALVDPPTVPSRLSEQALAYVDELYGFARHMCGNANDAEDLVQETYARALLGAPRLQEGSNIRAWMFRILRNCFIDQARRRKIVLEIPDDTIDEIVPEQWDSGALEQLRYLTASEIARAIAALPIELRTVLLLDTEGFSEAETADIMRCAAGTVKSRLSRAKARLRATLKELR